MELVFPSPDGPAPDWWYDALNVAVDRTPGLPNRLVLELESFTARAIVTRPRQVDIIQYEHGPTGRYLYVDTHGVVYRLLPPTARAPSGQFRETTLRAELARLQPPRFDPPAQLRPDGRPALRLIHGGGSDGD